MAATLSCALMSSALIFDLFNFAAAVPTNLNSLPKIRTASARRSLNSLGTEASSKSFLQTPLRVLWMSRLLIAHANSKNAGRESSIDSCTPMAIFICSSSVGMAPFSPLSPALPPAARSSISFCNFSASCIARTPALAALTPAPNSPIAVPKPLAFCFVRARCPPRPKNELSNPRYSSALTSKANPMVFKYKSPCAPCAIFTASSCTSCRKTSFANLGPLTSNKSIKGVIRVRRFFAHLTSRFALLNSFSSCIAAILSSMILFLSSSSIASYCSGVIPAILSSFNMLSAVCATQSSPMYGSTSALPNMTLKKTMASISVVSVSSAVVDDFPFLSYAARS
mmetsp:Transcript_3317/g.6034  ORF Transcript_3317/g.6034 Transcript_3317/m.6034 type:complete len:339 (+) Transcript_3317:1119-2135(+)